MKYVLVNEYIYQIDDELFEAIDFSRGSNSSKIPWATAMDSIRKEGVLVWICIYGD